MNGYDLMISNFFRYKLLVLCLLLTLPCAAQAITLDAKTHIVIVETGSFDNAGGALTDTLSKYLLAALQRESLDGDGPTVTITLEAHYAFWQDIPTNELTSVRDIDSFTVIISDATVRIKGLTLLATGYGMMDFLENDIGITWLFPGDLGVALPDKPVFTLKSATRTARPAIASRILSGHLYRNRQYALKYNVYTGALAGCSGFFKAHDYFKAMRPRFLAYSSHALFHIYPPKKIAAEYPQIMPIKDGKPVQVDKIKPPHGGPFHAWQPCYAKQATYDLAIAYARKRFDEGAYMVSLGVNDGRNILCECDHCSSIGWPHVYYQFVNRVAEACKDYYPPRMIGVMAYGSAGKSPVGMLLRDNVSVTVVARDADVFRTWSTISRHLGIYEYLYGLWYWLPQIPLDAMSSNAKFYRDNNVENIYAEAYPVWAFDGPKLYIRWKLMWDPDLDVRAALARYCEAAFGKGAAPMTKLYEHWAAKVAYFHEPDGLSPMVDMHLRQRPAEQFARCTKGDYARTDALLSQAALAADTDEDRKRIEMVRTFFDYSKTLHAMYALGADLTNADAPMAVNAAADRINVLHTKRIALSDTMAARDEWFIGTSSTHEMITETRWAAGRDVEQQLDVLLKAMAYTAAKINGPDSSELRDLSSELLRYAIPSTVEPKKPHVRKQHAWYSKDRYVVMQVVQDGNAVTFTPTAKGEALDPTKTYWINLILLNEPIDGKTAFVFDFDLDGADGSVQLMGQVGSNNRSLSVISQNVSLRANGQKAHKRFILEPLFIHNKTGQPVTTYRPADDGDFVKSHINVFILYTPRSANATLSGVVRVDKLTLPPVDTAP